MTRSEKWLKFYEITLDFIGRVLENKLALVMLFVLGVSAIMGVERMELMLNIGVDAIAKLIPSR